MSINKDAYERIEHILKYSQKSFNIFTANHNMQYSIVEMFEGYGIAVYDYTKNSAGYSFSVLSDWLEEQQAKIIFVINMQVALEDNISIENLNLSRDMLAEYEKVWFFGMDKDTDDRVAKIAQDFYSFVGFPIDVESEEIIGV